VGWLEAKPDALLTSVLDEDKLHSPATYHWIKQDSR
jgi:hypothetical protein